MKNTQQFPGDSRRLKKWQLILLGLMKPSGQVLNVLFPPGLPYTKLARAIIGLSLTAVSRTTVRLLIERGYIIPDKYGYRITPVGKKFSSALISWYVDRSPSRWDGRWRMVIFDIPETRKSERDYLRHLLLSYGFRKLQASVWASPYKVPREFNDKLWDMKLKYHVLYLLVSEIDYDRTLRRFFPELSRR